MSAPQSTGVAYIDRCVGSSTLSTTPSRSARMGDLTQRDNRTLRTCS